MIVLSTAAAGLTTLLFPGTVLRPALVMWLLLVCPGMTVVNFFRLEEAVIAWALALALSVAIDACIAGIVLYAGWWSPPLIFSIVISYCLIGAIVQVVVIVSRRQRRKGVGEQKPLKYG